jgi:hypothetical protein
MRTERWIVIGGATALLIYAGFLFHNLSYAMGGPDTGGYFNEAKMITEGRLTRPVVLVRELGLDDSWLGFFMPLGFAPSPHASMHPTYPAGLPFHLALAASIGGWRHAPYYIAPLAAIGCALLMFAVSRKVGLSPLSSMAAAAALVTLPPFLWHAVQPASDVLATFWALAAMWCAFESVERPSLAFAAGVAFAIGVWVRPTNLLLGIAFVIALRFRVALLARVIAAALPFAIALMWWNWRLYGSALRTGYGGFFDQVSWAGMLHAAPLHAEWLMRMLTPLAFPIGLLVVFDRSVEKWTRWMLLSWFGVFFVFYSFYGFFDGWLCIRFLLPAIPALLIGTLLLVRDAYRWSAPRYPRIAAVVAVALTIFICAAPARSTSDLNVVPSLSQMEKPYPRLIRWAEWQLPKRAIVITGVLSGPFTYFSDRGIARCDQLTDDRFQLLRAYAANVGLPWYAVVADDEIENTTFLGRFNGNWTAVSQMGNFTLYRLD